jgi:hypothetical protein
MTGANVVTRSGFFNSPEGIFDGRQLWEASTSQMKSTTALCGIDDMTGANQLHSAHSTPPTLSNNQVHLL